MAANASEIEAEIAEQFPAATPELDLARLAIGQDLKERGDVGIRPAHIVGAVTSADAVDAYEIAPDAKIVLALKKVPGIAYRILAIVVEAGRKTWVSDARRLYGVSDDTTPTQAFARFVEEFGSAMRGTKDEIFVPRRGLAVGQQVTAVASGVEISVQAFMRATPDGVEAAWMYAVDPARYRAAVRRHTR